jgi:hypothetical protein
MAIFLQARNLVGMGREVEYRSSKSPVSIH